MTIKGHFGKNDDIGGATGMMAIAGSQAESGVAGAVLEAGAVVGAAGVGGEVGPGGVGSEEPVLEAGETVVVRLGGGGDRTRGGIRRKGGTYKSSSSPTIPHASQEFDLASPLSGFLVCLAGGGNGAGGDIDGEGSGRAARVAGARAGSMGVLIGMAGEICGRALHH
jgi:hypothetical protein